MAAGKFNNGDSLSSIRTKLNANADLIDANETAVGTKAPSASPTFTGTPVAPTATTGTNTTQLATTAFVAQEIAAIPGGAAKTSGVVTASGSSGTPEPLIYDFNTITNAGYTHLPTTTEIGKEVFVTATNTNIYVKGNYAGDARITIDATNSYAGNLNVLQYEIVRFIHLGSGYWKAENVDGRKYKLNGKSLTNGQNNINIGLYNATTVALDAATLNSAYSDASFDVGAMILCPLISGGGKAYVRTAATTWAEIPLTVVA